MKNEQGFTLIEIIVALTLLGTGFLLVTQLFSGGARLASVSDRYILGVHLANHKFAELELQDFQTEDRSGIFEQDKRYRWELDQEPYPSTLNDPEEGIQLSQVQLRVFWQDGTREHEVRLVSLVPEGSWKPAPDVVLLGNVGLGQGAGAAALQTSASPPSGPRNITGTGNPIKSAGPGLQAPPGVSDPAQDPNFPQTDISGFPMGQAPPSQKPLIGVPK